MKNSNKVEKEEASNDSWVSDGEAVLNSVSVLSSSQTSEHDFCQKLSKDIELQCSVLGKKREIVQLLLEANKIIIRERDPFEAKQKIAQALGFIQFMCNDIIENIKRSCELRKPPVSEERYQVLVKQVDDFVEHFIDVFIQQQREQISSKIGDIFAEASKIKRGEEKEGGEYQLDANWGKTFFVWLCKEISVNIDKVIAKHHEKGQQVLGADISVLKYLGEAQKWVVCHGEAANWPEAREAQNKLLSMAAKLYFQLVEFVHVRSAYLHIQFNDDQYAIGSDSFNFTGKVLDSVKLEQLGLLIDGCTLRSLNLSRNQLEEGATLVQLSYLIERSQGLHTLILNNNAFGDNGLKRLLPVLKNHPSLKKLELQNTGLTGEAGKYLAELLMGSVSLEELYLHGNRLCDSGVSAIGEALSSQHTLRSLDLNGTGITSEGIEAFMQNKSVGDLVSIDLSYNPDIGDEGFQSIFKGVTGNLKVLKLANCGLTSQGIEWLLLATKRNPTLPFFNALEEWHVSTNQIGDKGFKNLIEAITLARSSRAKDHLPLIGLWLRGLGDIDIDTLKSFIKACEDGKLCGLLEAYLDPQQPRSVGVRKSDSVSDSVLEFFRNLVSSPEPVPVQRWEGLPYNLELHRLMKLLSERQASAVRPEPSMPVGERQVKQGVLQSFEQLKVLPMDKRRLQNELSKACENADLESVKRLVEKENASLVLPDEQGDYPLAKAIWGLAVEVVCYLDQKARYMEQDYLAVASFLASRHQGYVLPLQGAPLSTYLDWFNHYAEGNAPWFYDYEACLRRNYSQAEESSVYEVAGKYYDFSSERWHDFSTISWKEEEHVRALSYLDLVYAVTLSYGVPGVSLQTIQRSQGEQLSLSQGYDRQGIWFNVLCGAMADFLRRQGLAINDAFQLTQEEVCIPAVLATSSEGLLLSCEATSLTEVGKQTMAISPEWVEDDEGLQYTDDDITSYKELMVMHALGGFKKREAGISQFLLQECIFDEQDKRHYWVAVTDAVDTVGASTSMGYFLDKSHQPRDLLSEALTVVARSVGGYKQYRSADPSPVSMMILADLKKKGLQVDEGVVNAVIQKLEKVDFDENKLAQEIAQNQRVSQGDVFDELLPQFFESQDPSYGKILFPYNETNVHWLLGEIILKKDGDGYEICVFVHDPYGWGRMPPKVYEQVESAVRKRVTEEHRQFYKREPSTLNFKHMDSPYCGRQNPDDANACGVIVAEELIKRAQGESLDRQEMYSINALELRQAHRDNFVKYNAKQTLEGDRFITRFLDCERSIVKRNSLQLTSQEQARWDTLEKMLSHFKQEMAQEIKTLHEAHKVELESQRAQFLNTDKEEQQLRHRSQRFVAEKMDQLIMVEQRLEYIFREPVLARFHTMVQFCLSNILLATKALASGKIQHQRNKQTEFFNFVLPLVGDLLPLPGANVITDVMNSVITYHLEECQADRTQMAAKPLLTVGFIDEVSAEVAGHLTCMFFEHLRLFQTTQRVMQQVIDNAIDTLAQCAVERIVDFMRHYSIRPSKGLSFGESLALCVFYPLKSKKGIAFFRYLGPDQKECLLTTEGIFERSPLCLVKSWGNLNSPEYSRDNESRICLQGRDLKAKYQPCYIKSVWHDVLASWYIKERAPKNPLLETKVAFFSEKALSKDKVALCQEQFSGNVPRG